MSYAEFLKVLGSLRRRWGLETGPMFRQALRTRTRYNSYCPITAVYKQLTGVSFNEGDALMAGAAMGLQWRTAYAIVLAADDSNFRDRRYVRKIRRDLLRACKVKEVSWTLESEAGQK